MFGTQVSLIGSIAATFVVTLFTLIAILSMLRRRRDTQEQDRLTERALLLEVARVSQEFTEAETQPVYVPADPTPKHKPIPERFRLPVQPETPEQVILSIQPPEGPTRDQRNIQKLIDFLKKETIAVEPIQKVS